MHRSSSKPCCRDQDTRVLLSIRGSRVFEYFITLPFAASCCIFYATGESQRSKRANQILHLTARQPLDNVSLGDDPSLCHHRCCSHGYGRLPGSHSQGLFRKTKDARSGRVGPHADREGCANQDGREALKTSCWSVSFQATAADPIGESLASLGLLNPLQWMMASPACAPLEYITACFSTKFLGGSAQLRNLCKRQCSQQRRN